MIALDNELFIREEINGITVYDKSTDLYIFYEGIEMSDVEGLSSIHEVKKVLEINANHINRNIKFSSPFRVNWLIEEKCNLDCIYCFADDKMQERETREFFLNTAKYILELGVLNVGISGGEPTINPYLKDILESFNGKCSLSIDTNGTINTLRRIANVLKQSNTLVRITIDSTDPVLLEQIRPSKKPEYDQLSEVYENISVLLHIGVPVMVHTVVTQFNLNHLEAIAEKLIELGVKRWQLNGVNYSEKCKTFYDDIKISGVVLNDVYQRIKKRYENKLDITAFFDEGNYSADSIILIDSRGRFYLDSIKQGIHFIGKELNQPSLQEIREALDVQMHCLGYLWTPDML